MISSKEKIDLLLKEYEVRGIEISEGTARYHKQTNFTYLYASIIIAIAGVFSSTDDLPKAFAKLALSADYLDVLFIFLLVIAALIGFYLFASAMNSMYMILLNGARRAAIEEIINREIGEEVLVWDTKIIADFFSIKFRGMQTWVNPSLLVAIWVFGFFLITNILLCLLCGLVANRFLWFYAPPVIACTIISVQQYVALYTTGVNQISLVVSRSSGLQKAFWISPALTSPKRVTPLLLRFIPFITILIGPIPIAYFSILSQSFLPGTHPFPFIYNVSVLLGDLIFLPMFNYYFARILLEHQPEMKHKRRVVIKAIVISVVVGVIVQTVAHMGWIGDEYTGFMDTELGQLSTAGYWHLWYASVQTAAILLFIYFWFTLGFKSKVEARSASIGWNLFLAYILLGVVDLIINYLTVYHHLQLMNILSREWGMLLKLVVSVGVYLIARYKSSPKW